MPRQNRRTEKRENFVENILVSINNIFKNKYSDFEGIVLASAASLLAAPRHQTPKLCPSNDMGPRSEFPI